MKQIIAGFLILCGMGLMAACTKENAVYLESDTQEEYGETASEASVCQPASCYVYICGAVAEPGVYEVPEGGRICDALELAGGLTAEAEPTALNQAQTVEDGQMIRVPTREEARLEAEAEQTAEDGRVNINTATVQELMELPGIGASKAESIVSYREEHGAFSRPEELMNITGIKSGVYEKIRESIRVD